MFQRILLSLFLTLVLLYGVAFFVSEELNLETSLQIDSANPEEIYPLIADLGKWTRWNHFTNKGDGNDSGKVLDNKGAVIAINGKDERGNTISIKRRQAIAPTQVNVDYLYVIDQLKILTSTKFVLSNSGQGTKIVWTYSGDYRNLIGGFKIKRLLLLFSKLMIKREMKRSLETLSQQFEKTPQ